MVFARTDVTALPAIPAIPATPATPADRRSERTHLFLVATLTGGGISDSVRVRNLSPTGAQVEGLALPGHGTLVVLRRGALEAAGTIVWAAKGRAGVAFSVPVAVADWLPTKEARPLALTRLSPLAAIADLERLSVELAAFGEALVRDPAVAASHPEIQFFDAAAQRLIKIIDALRRAHGQSPASPVNPDRSG